MAQFGKLPRRGVILKDLARTAAWQDGAYPLRARSLRLRSGQALRKAKDDPIRWLKIRLSRYQGSNDRRIGSLAQT